MDENGHFKDGKDGLYSSTYLGTLHTTKNVPQSPLLGGVSVSPALRV